MTLCYVPNPNAFPRIKWNQYGLKLTKDKSKSRALLIGCEQTVDKSYLLSFPKLEVIGTRTTNDENVLVDDVDTVFLSKEDVSDVCSAAEFTMFLIFSLYKRARLLNDNMVYRAVGSRPEGFDVNGKSIAIFGYGRLGRMVTNYSIGFNMTPHLFTRSKRNKKGLLKKCDIISLHLPAKDEFVDFIDIDDFKVMKRSAILINTARPYMVNKEAIFEALYRKLIAGIALDYTSYTDDTKMDKDIALHVKKYENFIVTPHIAGSTAEAVDKTAEAIVKKVSEYFKGKK